MAQTCLINIDEKPEGGGAVFNPQDITVAIGDVISWCNNTPDPHWPAPKDKPKDTWMDAAIPGKLPGQPAPTSQQALSFSGATKIDYVCALHPEMQGTITVQ